MKERANYRDQIGMPNLDAGYVLSPTNNIKATQDILLSGVVLLIRTTPERHDDR